MFNNQHFLFNIFGKIVIPKIKDCRLNFLKKFPNLLKNIFSTFLAKRFKGFLSNIFKFCIHLLTSMPDSIYRSSYSAWISSHPNDGQPHRDRLI